MDCGRTIDGCDHWNLYIKQVSNQPLALPVYPVPVACGIQLHIQSKAGYKLVPRPSKDHHLVVRICADIKEGSHPIVMVIERIDNRATITVQTDRQHPCFGAVKGDGLISIKILRPFSHLKSPFSKKLLN